MTFRAIDAWPRPIRASTHPARRRAASLAGYALAAIGSVAIWTGLVACAIRLSS